MSPVYTLKELAELLGGELSGPGDLRIRAVCSLEAPTAEAITFLEHPRQVSLALGCGALAVVVPRDVALDMPYIRVDNPRLGFARLLEAFHPPRALQPGIHPSAWVSPQARVSPGAEVGPWCSLEAGVEVEAGTRLVARVSLETGCRIGPACVLQPGVCLGPGCVLEEGCILDPRARLGAQVQLGRAVYIGASSVLEEGCKVGAGTKVDNLVLMGHHAQLGEHCILVSHATLRARVRLGDYCILAAQASLDEGVRLASGVQVAGRGRVIEDSLTPGEQVGGDPARPLRQELKERADRARVRELVDWVRRQPGDGQVTGGNP